MVLQGCPPFAASKRISAPRLCNRGRRLWASADIILRVRCGGDVPLPMHSEALKEMERVPHVPPAGARPASASPQWRASLGRGWEIVLCITTRDRRRAEGFSTLVPTHQHTRGRRCTWRPHSSTNTWFNTSTRAPTDTGGATCTHCRLCPIFPRDWLRSRERRWRTRRGGAAWASRWSRPGPKPRRHCLTRHVDSSDGPSQDLSE